MADISKHGSIIVNYSGKPIPNNSATPNFIGADKSKSLKSYITSNEIDNNYSHFKNNQGHTYGVVSDNNLYHINMQPQYRKQLVTASDEYSQRKVDLYSGNIRPDWQPRPKKVQTAFFDPKPYGIPFGVQPSTGFQASRVVPRQTVNNVLPFYQTYVPPGSNIKGVSGGDFIKGNYDTYRPPDKYKTVDELRIVQKARKAFTPLVPAAGIKGTTTYAKPSDTTHWKKISYRTFTDGDLYQNTNSTQAQPIVGFVNPDTLTKTDFRINAKQEYSSGPHDSSRTYVHNSEDVPNLPMRSVYNKKLLNAPSDSNKTYVHNAEDVPNLPMRSVYNKKLLIAPSDSNKTYVHNAEDVPNLPMRSVYNKKLLIAPADSNKTYVHNAEDVPNLPMRSVYNKKLLNAPADSNKTYVHNADDVPNLPMRSIYNKIISQPVSATNEGDVNHDFSARINVNREHHQLLPPPSNNSKSINDTKFKFEKDKNKVHKTVDTERIQLQNQFNNLNQQSSISNRITKYPFDPTVDNTLSTNPYHIPYPFSHNCINLNKIKINS